MPSVSIVIPVFEPGPALGEALESVHAQTHRDREVVVVDDGSTEDLRWIAERFPDVVLIRQQNSGPSVARNRGVLASTGELVAFMDQDDVWIPRKLERQVEALTEHEEAGLCYCDLEVFRGVVPDRPEADGHDRRAEVVLDPGREGGEAPALSASLRHFGTAFVVPSTVIVRRQALAAAGLLDPWMPFTGDFDTLIRLGATSSVIRVPSPDVLYRAHDSNFSGQYDTGRRELAEMRRRYRAHGRALGSRELVTVADEVLRRPRRLYAHQAFDRARQSWRRGDRRGTAYHLYRSAAFDPRVVASAASARRSQSRNPSASGSA